MCACFNFSFPSLVCLVCSSYLLHIVCCLPIFLLRLLLFFCLAFVLLVFGFFSFLTHMFCCHPVHRFSKHSYFLLFSWIISSLVFFSNAWLVALFSSPIFRFFSVLCVGVRTVLSCVSGSNTSVRSIAFASQDHAQARSRADHEI